MSSSDSFQIHRTTPKPVNSAEKVFFGPPPKKSPKHNRDSSPGCGTPPVNPSEPTSVNLESLTSLFKSLSSSPIPEPSMLNSTDAPEIRTFLKEIEEYHNAGGKKGCGDFIDPHLREVITKLELGQDAATHHDFYCFLLLEIQPKSVDFIHATLQNEVCMDPTLTSGKAKIQSLFMSLSKTMNKLGLKTDNTVVNGFQYHFSQQKELLLSKLPVGLRKEYEVWALYKPSVTEHVGLYQQLKEVESSYFGSWDVPGQTLKGTRFSREMDEYEKEHQTRSSKGRNRG